MSNQTNPITDPRRAVTGKVRLSYVHLTKPYAAPGGGEERYSVTLLIPKNDTATLQRLQAAMGAAQQDALKDTWKGIAPNPVPVPIHDGDGTKQDGTAYGAECKAHYVMTASAKQKPEVIDTAGNPIIDATQIYSGMYGRVSIRFFGYFSNGKKGIGAGLGNVQKLEDGEPLGGYVSAADDFGVSAAPWASQTPGTPQFIPGQTLAAPAHNAPLAPQYGQPVPQQAPAYPAGQYAVDPITGLPLGGVKGL